jgi:hypothetical protein
MIDFKKISAYLFKIDHATSASISQPLTVITSDGTNYYIG